MKTKCRLDFTIIFVLLITTLTACEQNNTPKLYQQYSEYSFEDTLLNLDLAISEHNYRIIHRSQIGQAIRDRGDKTFPLSTITNFCNITYAKEMMEINTDLINEMPCTIAVREEVSQGVIVSSRLMNEHTKNQKQNAFAIKINNNLKSIIAATIE